MSSLQRSVACTLRTVRILLQAFCGPYWSNGVGRGLYNLHPSGMRASNFCRVVATHDGVLHLPAHANAKKARHG